MRRKLLPEEQIPPTTPEVIVADAAHGGSHRNRRPKSRVFREPLWVKNMRTMFEARLMLDEVANAVHAVLEEEPKGLTRIEIMEALRRRFSQRLHANFEFGLDFVLQWLFQANEIMIAARPGPNESTQIVYIKWLGRNPRRGVVDL